MVKLVDMREALQQVREKAPNTADAMKRFKSGNAGFTDKAHLKAKGLIPRADGTKKKSDKYEDLDKDDEKTIKPIIKQLQKSVAAHDAQAKQLKKDISDDKDLEEQIINAIEIYEPRARVTNISSNVNDDQHQIKVTVTFRIVNTNETVTTNIDLTRLR